MKLWNGQDFDPSKPEILAAYSDGEFEGIPSLEEHKILVEEWLEEHPEAVEEITAWRGVKRAWRQTTPPEPGHDAWDKVLNTVKSGVTAAEQAKSRKRALYWTWVAGGAAAAVLLVLAAGGYWVSTMLVSPGQGTHHVNKVPVKKPEVEVFVVAEPHEIEILRVDIRLDGENEPTLAVGNLPVEGSLELAEMEDIQITEVKPDKTSAIPEMVVARSDFPMIWAGGGLER